MSPVLAPWRILPVLGLLALACGQKVEPQPVSKAGKGKAAAKTDAPKPAPAPAPDPLPEPLRLADVGFDHPESVEYDSEADVYLVSNIGGAPTLADGNGFISRVTPETGEVHLRWIDGAADGVDLDAPKGLHVQGNTLYVADLRVLRKFDRRNGKALGTITIEGATGLNGVAAGPDGSVLVTDLGFRHSKDGGEPSGTDAVYRVDAEDQVTKLASGETLSHPNGVLLLDGDVWIASFGGGDLFRITADGEKVSAVSPEHGQLDGLVQVGSGEVLLSSWAGKGIYRGPPAGPFKMVIEGVEGPADIGWDHKRKLVLIPLLTSNAVEIRPLPRVEPR